MTRLLLLALATVGALLATPDARDWANLAKLDAGTPVAVVTAAQTHNGEFVASSTESLTLRTTAGQQRILRADVLRVTATKKSHRLRNFAIGAGVGVGIAVATDATLGTYLRNESNPDNARAVIWTVPIALCGGIGALFPGHPVIYRK